MHDRFESHKSKYFIVLNLGLWIFLEKGILRCVTPKLNKHNVVDWGRSSYISLCFKIFLMAWLFLGNIWRCTKFIPWAICNYLLSNCGIGIFFLCIGDVALYRAVMEFASGWGKSPTINSSIMPVSLSAVEKNLVGLGIESVWVRLVLLDRVIRKALSEKKACEWRPELSKGKVCRLSGTESVFRQDLGDLFRFYCLGHVNSLGLLLVSSMWTLGH